MSDCLQLDRNKTELTHKVTAAARAYLDQRGFKPLETEVPICDGWVADLAGVISPTQTELQELKLVPPSPRWNHPSYPKWYAKVKEKQKIMTCLVEVKTSMSDFRGDKKWTWLSTQFPVSIAYLAIPSTLPLERSQFPLSWGVLEYSESRDAVKCIQVPEVWTVSIEQQLSVILDVAVRCDHRTRHAEVRETRKEETIRRNEDVSRTRVGVAIRAVMAVVNGNSMCGKTPHASVEEALQFHGIKHVSAYDLEQLQAIWKTADAGHKRG